MSSPPPFTRFVPAERPLSFSRLRPTRTARLKIRAPVVLTVAGLAILGASAPMLLGLVRHAEPTEATAEAPGIASPQDARVAEIRAASDTSRPDWLGRLATVTPAPGSSGPGPEIPAPNSPAPKGKDEIQARLSREARAARIEAAASVTSSITPGPTLKPAPEKHPVRTISLAPQKPREIKAREVAAPEVKPRHARPRAERLRKIRVREAKPTEAERPTLAERLFGRRASLFKPAAPDTTR